MSDCASMKRAMESVVAVCLAVTLLYLGLEIGQLDYMLFLFGMSVFCIVMEISIQSKTAVDLKCIPLWRKGLNTGLGFVIVGLCASVFVLTLSSDGSEVHKLIQRALLTIPNPSISLIEILSLFLATFLLIESMNERIESAQNVI